MFPVPSVMALIKLQLFLSPSLLAPLQCHMIGAGEAVVGEHSEFCWEIQENSCWSTLVI